MTDEANKAGKRKRKTPRDAGQLLDRSAKRANGKSKGDKWLIRIYIGSDSGGRKHYHN